MKRCYVRRVDTNGDQCNETDETGRWEVCLNYEDSIPGRKRRRENQLRSVSSM